MLKNIRVKTKLLLMLAVPICGMLFFVAKDITDKAQLLSNARNVNDQIATSITASSLIHELQKERGLTAGYLASKGGKFKDELRLQREETDKKLAKMKAVFAEQKDEKSGLRSSLEKAESALAKLGETRQAADQLSLEPKGSFGFYSQGIISLLDIVSSIATNSRKTGLTGDLTAYYAFLNCKEQAGRERATLNGVFSANRFEDESFQRFLGILAVQSTYQGIFTRYAEENSVKNFNEKMAAPAVKQVEEMRTVALTKGMAGDFGVAPEVWFKTITEKINTMKEIEDGLSKGLTSKAETLASTARQALIGSILLSAIIILLALSMGFFIFRSISLPLARMVAMLKDIADGEGDLTKRLDSNQQDEIGQVCRGFNTFVDHIHTIVSQAVSTTEEVTSSTVQLHSTAEQIATAAEEVAAQSTTVATAGEEMSATSNDIARNCTMVAEASQRATSTASNGAQVVHETLDGMQQIAGQVQASANLVDGLGKRSDQIGNIVNTIQDIADQTNLLALNAAIEAARAGETGRGFAVVADEVRALAVRTTRATGEISEMIKAIQSETASAVASMEAGVQVAEHGMENSRRSAEALENILLAINEVTMQVSQIATAAEEQTATTNEISNNIHQITQVVQETANGAHQTSSAASHLSRLAAELKGTVGRFKLS